MKYRLAVEAAALVLLLVLAPAARALSFEFSGTWTASPAVIPAGTSFSGSFAYDVSSVGTPTPFGTTYFPGAMSVDVFGDGTQVLNFAAVMRVSDDSALLLPGSVNDFFQIGFVHPVGMPEAAALSALIGRTVLGLRLDFTDPERDAISSEALPDAAELLSFSAAFTTLALAFRDPDGSGHLQLGRAARVSEASAVPVPGSIALLLVALAGLGFSRRRTPS